MGHLIYMVMLKAERGIRTIENKCQKLLEGSSVNVRYWPEAVKTAAYTYNRIPNRFSIPSHIQFYGRYDQRKLYPFGCNVFYYDQSPCHKGQVRQRAATFLGYDKRSLMYRVLDLENLRVVSQMNIKKSHRNS